MYVTVPEHNTHMNVTPERNTHMNVTVPTQGNIRGCITEVDTSCNTAQGNVRGSIIERDATMDIPVHRKSYADILKS